MHAYATGLSSYPVTGGHLYRTAGGYRSSTIFLVSTYAPDEIR